MSYFKMSHDNMTEMNKLVVLLAQHNIPFEIWAWNYMDEPTWQVCCPTKQGQMVDAICHGGSYGHEKGLIEIMSEYEEDVVGWLTAEEALPYFQAYVLCGDKVEEE